MYLDKGKISAIVDRTHATVVPAFSDSPVTIELVIPFFLLECLEVGMEVVYAQFPDNSGVIIARMDGEWNHKMWDGLEVLTGNVKISSGDMSTGSVSSFNGHIHTCPDGTTSGPR